MRPSKVNPHALFNVDDHGANAVQVAWVEPATEEAVQTVIYAPLDGDGRSDWFWMRLQDGTLLLGTFPQGDTYEEFSEAGVCDFQEPDGA